MNQKIPNRIFKKMQNNHKEINRFHKKKKLVKNKGLDVKCISRCWNKFIRTTTTSSIQAVTENSDPSQSKKKVYIKRIRICINYSCPSHWQCNSFSNTKPSVAGSNTSIFPYKLMKNIYIHISVLKKSCIWTKVTPYSAV